MNLKSFSILLTVATSCFSLGGCGLLLKHATPEELGSLQAETRSELAKYEDERLRQATAWQFATRQKGIAAAEYEAVSAKDEVAEDLGEWAYEFIIATRLRLATEHETALGYCRSRFAALEKLHELEKRTAKKYLEAAEATEDEYRRRYNLAVAEQERARIAAVLDRPGVLKEDREKALSKWHEEIESQKFAVDAALVERRQADLRADDASKDFQSEIVMFKKRFERPCDIDWQLPGATSDLLQTRTKKFSDPNLPIKTPSSRPLPPPVIFTSPTTKSVPIDDALASPMMSNEASDSTKKSVVEVSPLEVETLK